MKEPVVLKFKKIDKRAVLPKYTFTGDMCMDLSVIVDNKDMKPFVMTDSVHDPVTEQQMITMGKIGELEYCVLEPHQSLAFHTGLKCSTPFGYGMNLNVRSSTGLKKSIRLCNGTGKIDTSQYRGEILLGLHNFSDTKSVKIFNGDRVAQAEIVEIIPVVTQEVDELDSTERGEGGFGSSGR